MHHTKTEHPAHEMNLGIIIFHNGDVGMDDDGLGAEQQTNKQKNGIITSKKKYNYHIGCIFAF